MVLSIRFSAAVIVATGIALASIPMLASPAMATPATAKCGSARANLSSDVVRGRALAAQYKVYVSKEQSQLHVAEQFGDSSRINELEAELEVDQPRYDLAVVQQKQAATDVAALKICSINVVRAVSNHITIRSLQRSRLVLSQDLKAQRRELGSLQGGNEGDGDEVAAEILEAKANIADDKQSIAKIDRTIHALT